MKNIERYASNKELKLWERTIKHDETKARVQKEIKRREKRRGKKHPTVKENRKIGDKILFLDIDGVVNCRTTLQRHRGMIGIDPYLAFLIGKIILDTGCTVVLSSSWRLFKDGGIEEISQRVTPIHHITPLIVDAPRGQEIQEWLDAHPHIKKYAIVDDDANMLETQLPNFFKTSWLTGITPDIAASITMHLNSP